MSTDLAAARADAVFVSDLPAGSHPTRDVVDDAIAAAVRRCGGTAGCACCVAQEYGDHPETAVARRRWAADLITALYRRGVR